MAITITNLTHQYPGQSADQAALRSVSVSIPTNQVTAIVGKTGSGKSTLIKHLNGLLLPTAGSIHFAGTTLTAQTRAQEWQRIRQRVGLVFQNPATQLFAPTVLADVMAGPLAFGLDRNQAERRALAALETVRVPRSLNEQSPLLLSGGQQRRVAIAGVLANQPEVVIFDEPTAGLDAPGQRELVSLFVALQRDHRTILVVTHEMDVVAQLAQWVLVLDQGQVAFWGTPAELFRNQPAVVASTNLELPTPMQLAHQLEPRVSHARLPLTEAELDEWVLRRLRKDDERGTTTT
ncbi:ATP-binding cassette domain-containing protein [Fructilactobacillus ixorae]|uniref:ATP-binding cassette domain-containing protein n=1 Tax=Fructilactobacillus ixorae TaxID=1750535 RepID=A0ABY5C766_9LACO|nr:ATP-binding cassette domain-containing protein [Fructilactobacillus ixorae]USS93151.1 ATP-binding cassette domain-containing protein [Fructilactobacillus ixorae]